jgi:predicted PurR-regulated permease PerM
LLFVVFLFCGTVIVLLTLAGAYIIVNSIRVILVLLIAIIIASAVRPFVNHLTRWHVPEGVAIVFVYLTLLAIIVIPSIAVAPPIVNQFAEYIENDSRLAFRIIRAQRLVEDAISDVTNEDVSLVAPEDIREAVSEFVAEVRRVMPSLLEDIGTTIGEAILIFVMGAYWLTSHEKATGFATQLVPGRYREKAIRVIEEIEWTMGGYVRGVVLIATIVGILNFTVLSVLGVPNAVTIAFIAGVTTTVPMVGGLVGSVLVIAITLVAAPEYVLTVAITVFVIQQIENHILSPRIMSTSAGVDPLLVIVYTSVGFVMSGIAGALIAVPVMGTLHILVAHLIIEPYRESMQNFQNDSGGIPLLMQARPRPQTGKKPGEAQARPIVENGIIPATYDER